MNNVCPLCQGTTWITKTVNGKEKCVRCQCYLNSKKDRLIKESRIPDRYQDCAFSNFICRLTDLPRNVSKDTELYEHIKRNERELSNAADQAKLFAEMFPDNNKGLLLMGPLGIGKTHLAVGICHYLIEVKGIRCIFYDFRELLYEIRSTYDPNSQLTESAVIHPLLACDLLVLDELGAEKTSDWVLDILMYILNYRYNRMGPTIITTNYPDKFREFGPKFEELLEDRIGVRLRSRLYEMCKTIKFRSDDYRRLKDAQAFKKGFRELLKRRSRE